MQDLFRQYDANTVFAGLGLSISARFAAVLLDLEGIDMHAVRSSWLHIHIAA